jgi:hypothetical protein
MKGRCAACGQPVEVVDFRLDEGLVVVRCSACGKEQHLSLSPAPGEAPAPPSSPAWPPPPDPPALPAVPSIDPAVEPPPGFCPKCIAPRAPGGTICPACGLVFANFQPRDHQPPEALLAAWKALSARWGAEDEHTRFLQLAGAADGLAAAGRLYRIRLAQAPEDALARAGVEATLKMAAAPVAVAGLRRAPEPPPAARRKMKLAVVALVFLGPMVLVYVLLLLLGGH